MSMYQFNRFELKVMYLFWLNGALTVREAHKMLSGGHAYSMLMETVLRLEEKETLKRIGTVNSELAFEPAFSL